MNQPQAEASTDGPQYEEPLGFFGLIGMIIGIFAAVLRALVWAHGIFNGEVVGYALAGAITSFLIAYAIAGRKSKRNLKKFGLWFGAVGILLLMLEVTNSIQHSVHVNAPARSGKVSI